MRRRHFIQLQMVITNKYIMYLLIESSEVGWWASAVIKWVSELIAAWHLYLFFGLLCLPRLSWMSWLLSLPQFRATSIKRPVTDRNQSYAFPIA